MSISPEELESVYGFHLPESQIARYPSAERDSCRLMVLEKGSLHSLPAFRQIERFLRPGDVLVYNSTKVSHRRIYLQYPFGSFLRTHESVFLEAPDPTNLCRWLVLLKSSKKLALGSTLYLPHSRKKLILRERGERDCLLESEIPLTEAVFEEEGTVPIPPYLKRKSEELDKTRYQTVFAKNPGSVAAPTAGLHFTQELRSLLESQGIQFLEVNLQIGYGTFQPLESVHFQTKKLHEEKFSISPETAEALTLARKDARRVIAIGTTTLRVLESIYVPETAVYQAVQNGATEIFLQPGDPIPSIDGLITNFHLPASSLLLLVSAFGGTEPVLKAYQKAIAEGYQFYSYGDAMLILP